MFFIFLLLTNSIFASSIPVSLIWVLTIEGMKEYAIYMVFLNGILLSNSLGLDKYYMREFRVHKNIDNVFSSIVGITSLISIIIAIILILTGNFVDFSIDWRIIVLSVLNGLLLSINRLVVIKARYESNTRLMMHTQILPKLLLLLVVFVFYIANFNDLFYFLLITFIVTLLSLSSFLIKSSVGSSSFYFWKGDTAINLKVLRFSFPFVVSGFSFWGLTSLDRIALSPLEDVHLSVYSAGATIVSLLMLGQVVISSWWIPKTTTKNNEIVSRDVLILSILIAFIWFVFLAVYSDIIVVFLPSDYIPALSLIPYLSGYPFLYVLSEVVGVHSFLSRKSTQITISTLGSLLFLIVSLCIFNSSLSALLVSKISYGSFVVFYYLRLWFCIRFFGLFTRSILVFSPILVTLFIFNN